MEHALQSTNLADILERILDKGIVIAGDVTVALVDIELLSIRLRLVIASVDKAKELGINWWEADPRLSTRAEALATENRTLQQRVDELEGLLGRAVPARPRRGRAGGKKMPTP